MECILSDASFYVLPSSEENKGNRIHYLEHENKDSRHCSLISIGTMIFKTKICMNLTKVAIEKYQKNMTSCENVERNGAWENNRLLLGIELKEIENDAE